MMTVPFLPDLMEQNSRVEVLVTGTSIAKRRAIDFTAPSGSVVVSAEDDSTNEKVTVTLSSGWTTVSKAADQTKTSDTTLANDTALSFSMLASTNYRIRGLVWFDTQDAPDFKYAFSGPSSPTLVRGEVVSCIAGGTPAFATVVTSLPGSTALTGAGNNGGYLRFEFAFQNGTTAGTFAFQWAQNTSDAGGTRVRAGSYLEYAVA
jgi:hypothetical protein